MTSNRINLVLRLDDILGHHNRKMLQDLGIAFENSSNIPYHENLLKIFIGVVEEYQSKNTEFKEYPIFEAFFQLLKIIENNHSHNLKGKNFTEFKKLIELCEKMEN